MKKELQSGKDKKKRALEISIHEGAATSFSNGISNAYITPFALKLSAKEIHIGILSSIAGLIAPLMQLYGSKLMDSYGRKKIVREIFTQLNTPVVWQGCERKLSDIVTFQAQEFARSLLKEPPHYEPFVASTAFYEKSIAPHRHLVEKSQPQAVQ